jgi:hypothetical protein
LTSFCVDQAVAANPKIVLAYFNRGDVHRAKRGHDLACTTNHQQTPAADGKLNRLVAGLPRQGDRGGQSRFPASAVVNKEHEFDVAIVI